MPEGGVRLRCAAPWARVEPEPVVDGWHPSRRARQLALGVWIERQVEVGRVRDYAHMARILGVSRARVAQLGVGDGTPAGRARGVIKSPR